MSKKSKKSKKTTQKKEELECYDLYEAALKKGFFPEEVDYVLENILDPTDRETVWNYTIYHLQEKKPELQARNFKDVNIAVYDLFQILSLCRRGDKFTYYEGRNKTSLLGNNYDRDFFRKYRKKAEWVRDGNVRGLRFESFLSASHYINGIYGISESAYEEVKSYLASYDVSSFVSHIPNGIDDKKSQFTLHHEHFKGRRYVEMRSFYCSWLGRSKKTIPLSLSIEQIAKCRNENPLAVHQMVYEMASYVSMNLPNIVLSSVNWERFDFLSSEELTQVYQERRCEKPYVKVWKRLASSDHFDTDWDRNEIDHYVHLLHFFEQFYHQMTDLEKNVCIMKFGYVKDFYFSCEAISNYLHIDEKIVSSIYRKLLLLFASYVQSCIDKMDEYDRSKILGKFPNTKSFF